ncbi:MAG: recombinase family protein [Phycisphaeraceae bacterium]|nr:recombinase family protein [Phycisphaeraceae bacterium]
MAKRYELEVVQVFVERQTAKRPGRPMFGEMLDRIAKGDASGIIAWHPDRLARNSMDGGRVIYLIDTGVIRDLRFPTFTFEPTAQGKFMLSVMFGQSKYYSDNLGENVRRGKNHRIKNGHWPQVAPLGYVNDRNRHMVVPHPVYGPLVTKLFELYATGDYTLKDVRRIVSDLGLLGPRGRPPSDSRIQHALQNPFYYGLLRYKGEFYQGKHEPLVSQEVFDKCRVAMNDHARFKTWGVLKPFMYRGHVRCGECGSTITMEIQKGHRYLRCTKKRGQCSQKYLREEHLHEQVRQALWSVSIEEDLAGC